MASDNSEGLGKGMFKAISHYTGSGYNETKYSDGTSVRISYPGASDEPMITYYDKDGKVTSIK